MIERKLFLPRISKGNLLFVAAFVWTFASGMLLYKGIAYFFIYKHLLWLKIIVSIIGGIVFYLLLFSRIAHKHINRIINLENERPSVFSFFNFQSYVMMTVMITMGIFLRISGIIPMGYLSVLYFTMGIPLSISAFRFYHSGFRYRTAETK